MINKQQLTSNEQQAIPRRSRKTKKSVILIDRLATAVISVGGVLVIVAVMGIMVFLATAVVPLFQGAKVNASISYKLPLADNPLLFAEIDDYLSVGMILSKNGVLTTFHAPTGKKMFEEQVIASKSEITAFSRSLRGGYVAVGFANGEVSLGNLSFKISFLNIEDVPEEFKNLDPGKSVVVGKGVLERAPEGQFRKIEEHVEFVPPVKLGAGDAPIVLIDYKPLGDQTEELVGLKADGQFLLSKVQKKKNLVTGKVTTRLDEWEIPYEATQDLPTKLLLTDRGDQIYLAWKEGTLLRYDLRNLQKPVVAEKTDIVAGEKDTLTNLKFMIGDQSLVSTDSTGKVLIWFRVEKGSEARGKDGYELVSAKVLKAHQSSVSALAVSPRDKNLITATSDGEVFLHHMTSEQFLLGLSTPSKEEILTVQLAPKLDGIFAIDKSSRGYLWKIYNPHPETTFHSIFGKVWYEGYPEPTYTWQSSSGTDDFEPKLSLIPLAFGTFKATLYSLLFAVPIAIMAAVYTSEFLDKKLRAIIKPEIEMMASLPSVVLGFIAALVLAPFIENWVLSTLFAFGIAPIVLLLAGYAWQLIPQKLTLRLAGAPQFVIMAVTLVIGFNLASHVGLLVEGSVFEGDFKAWLSGRTGTGTPLWFVLFLPFSLLAVFLIKKWYVDGWVREKTSDANQFTTGLIEFVSISLIFITSGLLSYLLGSLLTSFGFDLRGELVGTYAQRNTLIVGFVMGFAVIPIIYTITEDALAAVPEPLRAASLGCGATRWQTAMRVIIPTAASGIFSAIMIGLGRAVGETMIVVMAAGNTPVLDLNIFSGLRTLSANIAVELPEAVKDSTLYRMLFLAALLLFVMTFTVNTVAEIVRLRYRKKAYQL
jgi:phosphate transport system permease protein